MGHRPRRHQNDHLRVASDANRTTRLLDVDKFLNRLPFVDLARDLFKPTKVIEDRRIDERRRIAPLYDNPRRQLRPGTDRPRPKKYVPRPDPKYRPFFSPIHSPQDLRRALV